MSSSLHFPVELFRLVVDQLPDFASSRWTTQKELRSTLRSLCLTSRAMREFAQPVLFHCIRLDNPNGYMVLDSLITNNRSNPVMALVRIVLLLDLVRDSRAKELANLAPGIEQLIVVGRSSNLEDFSGSSVKRIFINYTRLALSRLIFPSLTVLGIATFDTDPDAITATVFPSLRHLVYLPDEDFDEADAKLERLVPTLDSITLLQSTFLSVTAILPSVAVEKFLVISPWNHLLELAEEDAKIVHFRILFSNVVLVETFFPDDCAKKLDHVTLAVETSGKFPLLETLYLPHLDSLSTDFATENIRTAVGRLSQACERRNIVVVFEEQAEELTGEGQISEDFMRRRSKLRTDGEAHSNEQEGVSARE